MNRRSVLVFAVLLVLIHPAQRVALAQEIRRVDFQNRDLGTYSTGEMYSDWGSGSTWLNGLSEGRGRVVEYSSTKVLEVKYPATKIQPVNSGVQWLSPIPSGTAYTLKYRVKFNPGFDWVRGGKLPGLAGGSIPAGGVPKADGFSARYMWRENGKSELYFYNANQYNQWKAGQRDQYGWRFPFGVTFETNKWYEMAMYARMNTPGKNDGRVKVWINGALVMDKGDLLFRLSGATWGIDRFWMSTFYGGNDATWAPTSDQYIQFDDIVVTRN